MSHPDDLFPNEGSGLRSNGERGLAFGKMYTFVFEHPQWMANLLMVLLCMLVPWVGMIVALGYVAELWAALHLRPQSLYPAFDFNRLVPYLTRGLWVFLVQMIGGMLIAAVIGPLSFAGRPSRSRRSSEERRALASASVGAFLRNPRESGARQPAGFGETRLHQAFPALRVPFADDKRAPWRALGPQRHFGGSHALALCLGDG